MKYLRRMMLADIIMLARLGAFLVSGSLPAGRVASDAGVKANHV
jgi:hypothetical protein